MSENNDNSKPNTTNDDKITSEGDTNNNNDSNDDNKIKVKVKTTSDVKFEINIDPSKSVLELKKAIAIKSPDKVEPSLQRLIYKGHVLKDDKILNKDYSYEYIILMCLYDI